MHRNVTIRSKGPEWHTTFKVYGLVRFLSTPGFRMVVKEMRTVKITITHPISDLSNVASCSETCHQKHDQPVSNKTTTIQNIKKM